MQEVFENIIKKLEEQKAKGIYDSNSIIGEKNVWANAIEIVKQAAADYNNGWIPCSEMLPEKNQLVLVCAESTTISSGTIRMVGAYANGAWFIQNSVDTLGFPCIEYRVIAWQPLPKPCQPKGE